MAESLRQRLKKDDADAVRDFVQRYVALTSEQLLQLEQEADRLSRREHRLNTMPKLINPFIELGKLKGRQEGLLEGRQEGRFEIILGLVKKKFPSAAKKATPLLRKLTEEEDLLSFAEALLFMETPAQCIAWLEDRV